MNLNNELNKIKYYAVNKKTIELNEVLNFQIYLRIIVHQNWLTIL